MKKNLSGNWDPNGSTPSTTGLKKKHASRHFHTPDLVLRTIPPPPGIPQHGIPYDNRCMGRLDGDEMSKCTLPW